MCPLSTWWLRPSLGLRPKAIANWEPISSWSADHLYFCAATTEKKSWKDYDSFECRGEKTQTCLFKG